MQASDVPMQVVDPRGRGMNSSGTASATAVAIPANELWIRATYELDPRTLVVVDCRLTGNPTCERAIRGLRLAGFSDVAGVNLRSMGRSATCLVD